VPKTALCSNSWSFTYAWLRMCGPVVLQPQGFRRLHDHRLSQEIDLFHPSCQERHAQKGFVKNVTSHYEAISFALVQQLSQEIDLIQPGCPVRHTLKGLLHIM
jgi:hypothetical protein